MTSLPRAGRVLAVTAALVGAATLPTADAKTERSCRLPSSASLVVAFDRAVVWETRPGLRFGCLRGVGRAIALDPEAGSGAEAPWALAGRRLAFALGTYEGTEPEVEFLNVRNLATGRLEATALTQDVVPPDDPRRRFLRLTDVVLARDGRFAFLACESEYARGGVCVLRRGMVDTPAEDVLIVRAPLIRRRSLTLSASQRSVGWTQDGRRRSAPLPRVPG
ncbi:MAG: hypothetical protein AVDCRST_MAG85-3394 [uncultured Solirubrobacteraceae bacterium]|uniref:Phytase-like domain-containing protein n=1 Tax=uncultured Solirubrobacteraceae bacterium TaxID=1162706 RepID=A0A6J4TPD6_9ACTN|nr:MAG: hypothetical protein AVDCRST_MAG85-3394 [uncultured Solirubrobacteraceae bacterium]